MAGSEVGAGTPVEAAGGGEGAAVAPELVVSASPEHAARETAISGSSIQRARPPASLGAGLKLPRVMWLAGFLFPPSGSEKEFVVADYPSVFERIHCGLGILEVVADPNAGLGSGGHFRPVEIPG